MADLWENCFKIKQKDKVMFQNIITAISFFFLKQSLSLLWLEAGSEVGAAEVEPAITIHQSTPHSRSSPLQLPLILQGGVKSSNCLKLPRFRRTPSTCLYTLPRFCEYSPIPRMHLPSFAPHSCTRLQTRARFLSHYSYLPTPSSLALPGTA